MDSDHLRMAMTTGQSIPWVGGEVCVMGFFFFFLIFFDQIEVKFYYFRHDVTQKNAVCVMEGGGIRCFRQKKGNFLGIWRRFLDCIFFPPDLLVRGEGKPKK